MEVVNKEITEHRATNIDPADPVLFRRTSTQCQLSNAVRGQLTHELLDHSMDKHGRRFDEQSLPIRSGISNEMIHAQSSAQCPRCYSFVDRRFVAKYVPPEKMRGVLFHDPATNTNFEIPFGYCKRCWWRVEIWKYILKGCLWLICLPFILILKPLVALHEAEPAPVYTPHPRTDPTMKNLSATSPEATNDK
ncbi:MAG: hypothetical protein PHR77_03285 [Kiritimatiellae bacterium]|nr:hypothetical protein [Kiritimatiellia bacterium]